MAGEATYRRGAAFHESFKQQVEILRSADANAVISVGSYAACAAFIRDARDAGWNAPLANVSFVGSENLLDLLQVAGQANGTDYTQNLINSQVALSYQDLSLPAVVEFRQLMSRYQPTPPHELLNEEYEPAPLSFVSFEGFLNAKTLVAILKTMQQPLDRKRLKQATEAMHDLDIGNGRLPLQTHPVRPAGPGHRGRSCGQRGRPKRRLLKAGGRKGKDQVRQGDSFAIQQHSHPLGFRIYHCFCKTAAAWEPGSFAQAGQQFAFLCWRKKRGRRGSPPRTTEEQVP
jgi:Periplasmic binding protein